MGEARGEGTAARHEPSPPDEMPPLALPMEHFAAGLLWLGLGAAGLVLVAPDLSRAAYLNPRVVAVTHCFTLGWITTSIFGALYQIYPVALGVAARSARMGHVTFWVLTAAVATLVVGAWGWHRALLVVGWSLLFVAVGLESWNLLGRRRKARRGQRIGLYVAAGHVGLGLAMFVVLGSIGGFLGWWPVNRMGNLSAHVHLAAVGFATLTAVGVGSKIFPAFLTSRGHREWLLRWIAPVALAGLVMYAAGAVGRVRALQLIGGLLTAVAVGLYLLQAAGYFRHRAQRRLGPAVAQVAVAHIFLAAACGVGILLLLRGPNPRVTAVYGVTGLLGWLALLVAGVYLKIVPTLAWLHRFSAWTKGKGPRKPEDLIREGLAWTSFGFLDGGVVILASGVLAARPSLATLGASLFAAGVALVLLQHLQIVTRVAGKRLPGLSPQPPLVAISGACSSRVALDVRPMLEAGEEPLERILEAASSLEPGGVLEITAPFEPLPLYRVLSERGFGHTAEQRAPGEWRVTFTRLGNR